jgi:hypothetical protein
MNFLYLQIIIFILMIISSIIGGKKGNIICGIVWVGETIISMQFNSIQYIQIITVAVSFQIGLIIAIIRDLIVKKISSKNNIKN